jgi:diguanylate cyclase (GGDEF)-like protein
MIDIIFEGLYTTMKSGGSKADIDQFIIDVERKIPNSKILLHKTIPGNIDKKQHIDEAFKNKKDSINYEKNYINYSKTIVYQSECLQCHSNASIGEVAAVIEFKYSYWDLNISIMDLIVLVAVLILVILLVIFSIWYVFLNKYFITPIKELIAGMKVINSHDDLQETITINTPIKEIKDIEDVFNQQNSRLLNLYDELENASNIDPLTKIYNRKMFDTLSTASLDYAKRYKEDFTLLSIDLNKFKFVNDTYGHHYGDMLLIEFTSRTSKILRSSDVFFRVGGDEFIIFLPRTNIETAKTVINKIKLHFKDNVFKIDDLDYYISASFGIAQYGIDGNNIEDLMKSADSKMYEDKKGASS